MRASTSASSAGRERNGECPPSSSTASTPSSSRDMRRDHDGSMTRSSRQRIEVRSTSGSASAGQGSRRGAADWGRNRETAHAASAAVQSW